MREEALDTEQATTSEVKARIHEDAHFNVNRMRTEFLTAESNYHQALDLVAKNEIIRNLALDAFEEAIRKHERLR